MPPLSRVAFALGLSLLAVAGMTACGSSTSDASVVAQSHAAVDLHRLGSVEAVSTAARQQGIDFVCGTFRVPGQGDPVDTSACMISDDGLVAVIAFNPTEDMTYELSGPALDTDVTVPVDQTDVYGVEATPNALTLTVVVGASVIGNVTFGA